MCTQFNKFFGVFLLFAPLPVLFSEYLDKIFGLYLCRKSCFILTVKIKMINRPEGMITRYGLEVGAGAGALGASKMQLLWFDILGGWGGGGGVRGVPHFLNIASYLAASFTLTTDRHLGRSLFDLEKPTSMWYYGLIYIYA